MKKHQSYLVLLFAVLISGTLNAKISNYVGGYADLGEWTLLPSESSYGPSFGVAGGLGFLYELQAGPTYGQTRFLFDVGVGAQGGLTSFIQGSNLSTVLSNQLDLDGQSFDYVYELKDRHDKYSNIAVQVPLMVGVQHRKFYALAGAKITANVFTKSHTTATLTTYGRYEDFDDFRDMPEYQFFTGRPLESGVKTSFKLDVDLSAEIGGRFGVVTDAVGYDVPKRKIEYRLAGFFDYGLLDIHYQRDQLALGTRNPSNPDQILPIDGNLRYNEGVTAPVYNTTSMVDNVVVNDIMSSSGFAKAVNSLVIGLKFTVLFQLPEQGKCVLCKDAYRSSVRHRSGGVQYEE
ncbi:MAG: hypothetical protein J6T80_02080 [Paludibacteraceae bacterium]|nr:hypothetical protein [Paludibacteraceae bacterium]